MGRSVPRMSTSSLSRGGGAARPITAAPELRNWREQCQPPYTVVVHDMAREMHSTNQTLYVRPPANAGYQWKRNQFKPSQQSAQPIWQTEVATGAPWPESTNESTFRFHRIPAQKPLMPPRNPAPYEHASVVLDPIPRSTSEDAFRSYGGASSALRARAINPTLNPPPFSSTDGPGVGLIMRSTSTDAFPATSVTQQAPRASCKPKNHGTQVQ